MGRPQVVAGDEYPSLETLAEKRAAVVSGEQWGAFVATQAPRIKLVYQPDTATALEAISRGDVSALVSDMATVSYYIHREGMTDIRIVGRLDETLEMGIATRKDWPELNLIMEKALDSISHKERQAIARQWIHLKVPSLVLGKAFWVLLSSVLVIITLVFLGFIFWNRSLRGQVAARTRKLKQELEWRTAAELEIQEAYDRLSHTYNECKETQLQWIRAAKMESVGSLAAGVAHEVKNPLMQIRLGLDYVSKVVVSDPVSSGVLQDMEKAVRRADAVINNLLDFSRESELSKNLCSLNTVIEDSFTLVQHELVKKGIRVELDLQSHLPSILLDENKIHQVFINLLQNATQAMSRNGVIHISTSQGGWPGKNILIAEVKDTGPGVSPENMDKILDPFYTTKPIGKGTGLGLYVTRNILELHEAKIEIFNHEEGGLLVRILFPAE
ncbi:MAG: ATP-binding protein [Geopsychrobacter sp.]|nr:ATP-binding protein [Geopsychrobacter sp.]